MDMILKVQTAVNRCRTERRVETAVNRCRTERELRDYYRSLDRGEQEMDMVIDMCYKRLLEIRNRQIKRGDLLSRDW